MPIATLNALVLAIGVPAQAQAPFWRGVDVLAIDCRLPDASPVTCSDVVAEARRNAPIAVRASQATDAEERSTIILDVRINDGPTGSWLTLAARRAVVIDEAQGAMLPRRFDWPAEGTAAACTAMLAHALDRTLPWRADSQSRRHLPDIQGRRS